MVIHPVAVDHQAAAGAPHLAHHQAVAATDLPLELRLAAMAHPVVVRPAVPARLLAVGFPPAVHLLAAHLLAAHLLAAGFRPAAHLLAAHLLVRPLAAGVPLAAHLLAAHPLAMGHRVAALHPVATVLPAHHPVAMVLLARRPVAMVLLARRPVVLAAVMGRQVEPPAVVSAVRPDTGLLVVDLLVVRPLVATVRPAVVRPVGAVPRLVPAALAAIRVRLALLRRPWVAAPAGRPWRP